MISAATGAGLGIIYLPPYFTTILPSPLITIVVLTAVTLFFGMDVRTVGDMGELPSNKNRECVGQGVANVATGFLGGMAGCAMIGQSNLHGRISRGHDYGVY